MVAPIIFGRFTLPLPPLLLPFVSLAVVEPVFVFFEEEEEEEDVAGAVTSSPRSNCSARR